MQKYNALDEKLYWIVIGINYAKMYNIEIFSRTTKIQNKSTMQRISSSVLYTIFSE